MTIKKPRKHTGLGKGISALIPDLDLDSSREGSDFFNCPVASITPNRYQPRTRFNEEELERLKDSVRQQGILQPLLVRNMDGGYELIAGERRLRAAKAAELTHVPVIVKDLTDEQVLEVSIIENIQRQNLNVLEEAEAYARLIDEFGYTQEKVAGKIGKNRSTIANLLRLRSLPDEIKESLLSEEISMGHARALLGSGSREIQLELFRQVVAKKLSVRQTEQLAKQAKTAPEKVIKALTEEDKALLEETSAALSARIHSPVNVKMNGNKGRIEIRFKSRSELQRLIDLLHTLS